MYYYFSTLYAALKIYFIIKNAESFLINTQKSPCEIKKKKV